MVEWLRKRPWFWVVLLLVLSALADFVLLWIATRDAPPLIN